MSAQSSVLYDVPGPRARVRNKILTAVFSVLALLAVFWIYLQFADAGQLDADLWTPFLEATTWTQYILPGLLMTLQAAAVAMVSSADPHLIPTVPATVMGTFCTVYASTASTSKVIFRKSNNLAS